MFGKSSHCKGPFTQNVSGNANARMGAKPIEDAAVALPLMLTLCVNRMIHNANVPLKKQRKR